MSEFKFPKEMLCPQDKKITKEKLKTFSPYYCLKHEICKRFNPKKIAEIGVRAGYSAWSFLQACPKSEYVGIDANNGTHGGQGGENGVYKKWAESILKPYSFRLIDMDTQKANDLGLKDVDFFHVDGDHTEKGVQHDLDLAFASLSKNGVILVDDIDYIEDVKNGVNKWIKKNKVRTEYVKSLRGEMIIYKNRKN